MVLRGHPWSGACNSSRTEAGLRTSEASETGVPPRAQEATLDGLQS